jgi:hypothetical protein
LVELARHTYFGIGFVDFQSAESPDCLLDWGMQTGTMLRLGDMSSFQVQLVMLVAATALADRKKSDSEKAVRILVGLGRLIDRRNMLEREQGHRRGWHRSWRQPGFLKGPSTV